MRTSVIAALLLAACSSGPGTAPRASQLPGDGILDYTIRSPAGDAVITGRLTLTVGGDGVVSGHWEAAWLPGADTTLPMGPQVGAGTLAGRRHADTLSLDLTPGYADNNVAIVAISGARGYEGHWGWTTFSGPRSSGAFRASPP